MQGNLVAVSWFDAHADAKAELSQDEINSMGSYKFTTYGILVRDDRGKNIIDPIVAIAAEKGDDGRYRGVTFVPAGMVFDVVDLGSLKRKNRRKKINGQVETSTPITES